jgi:SAM-dependent methyltransferase
MREFTCPICAYIGAFTEVKAATGFRPYAQCPRCHALERHRLQYLVLQTILGRHYGTKPRTLHFAPEPCLAEYLRAQSSSYISADLSRADIDCKVDITAPLFKDGSFDLVYASHVLEHVKKDMVALKAVAKLLAPGGIAILPVPIVGVTTVEYSEPNAFEAGHVRAPGMDYYARYKGIFSQVVTYTSWAFDTKYQTLIYEDRSIWPTRGCPLRQPMQGECFDDVVPVCYK